MSRAPASHVTSHTTRRVRFPKITGGPHVCSAKFSFVSTIDGSSLRSSLLRVFSASIRVGSADGGPHAFGNGRQPDHLVDGLWTGEAGTGHVRRNVAGIVAS